MKIPKHMRVIQMLAVITSVLYLVGGVKDLIYYYQLLETSIWHAPLQYQLYALVYIVRLLILVGVFVLTIILINDIYKNFEFSAQSHMRILYISLGIMIFSAISFLSNSLQIEPKYMKVLNMQDLSDTLLMVLGTVMLIFGTIYEKSRKLKEENDLTI
ncbi:DUF2975 domain-containing protein [Staphylococcus delphini]|uniref:DUF2975 domain-containing protein n=1 Tax=Staphylococcus delphini TaxID=53344 RepID=A0A2A4H0H3_9STAP|nr:DUF2975 domain-containing protein [Staphylococcus delphini]MBZ8174626.1 DUF2975 domain-containing protein [Staphylococcus delphini]PCF56776.1 hypothetical protein B5C08_01710 [Staphylococcus delphini]PCF62944.1 hypothetical protein B5C01_02210 [Staphylococcus delphini]PCF72646.1 hypothetical protein B4W72_07710 [Staphylococcus delphini]UXS21760.1 DUF2975 domain-containing protein [Staphylococcus delphini]